MRNVVIVSFNLVLLCVFVYAITSTKSEVFTTNDEAEPFPYHVKVMEFIWRHLGYQHEWPEMEFGWRICVSALIAILGAACGSVGGVGGGGMFVPMLIVIIGFDPKSAVAISKCMVTGAAFSALFYCMKQKHPTLDEPVIDYDLMLLMQPMLLLGISIGVILSVVLADWMVTVLLIILCTGTSIRAFFKGAKTWKKETKMKQKTIKLSESTATSSGELGYKYLPGCPDEDPEKATTKSEVTFLGNIYWREFVLIFCVWLAFVVIHIAKIPISVGFYLYQARSLYMGRSAGGQHTHWPLHHLFLASVCSLLAGTIGGLLGTGSGFVMGPLFLEVGIAPQVASATATFGMMYSSSLSVVEYYFLNRFPVPYALFLTLVAATAALIGQHLIDKLVNIFQRASLIIFVLACTIFVSAIALGDTKSEVSDHETNGAQSSYHIKALEFIWNHLGYQHEWPEMEFGWRIVVGTLIGILGAACGSVGGVGGGGIFVPMLIVIIGFDPKSAVAISKCMVTGAAISAVFFCLKQKHPTLDEPVIDYDLMLLIQPMLLLGISIGVILSVIFADWMVTILLIILCIGTSIRAFFKGAKTWEKETKMKQVNATNLVSDSSLLFNTLKSQQNVKLSESTATCSGEGGYNYLPCCPDEGPGKETRKPESYTVTCSITFWILILSQIPISVGFYLYQARGLHKGRSAGGQHTQWPLHHLFLASICSLLAGTVGGLLGTGSGFVMGPLFLEVGIAPQVASATATFGMMYSSSLSVVQFYLLNRFPVPYALYLTLMAATAALIGQHLIDKLVNIFQRASLIIFILACTIFVSAIALGGVGISNMILEIKKDAYMGFEDFCMYNA
ncbi:hypothetical protein VNO78_30626 [Psophocarpus tetragonolobus]|uniref:Sulfite exporter TauE/SafE family protein n=1 Tax=Psophocarpus tetragonolobus TaxID=3891 RepID=A0AAN9RWX3_PSOTE